MSQILGDVTTRRLSPKWGDSVSTRMLGSDEGGLGDPHQLEKGSSVSEDVGLGRTKHSL